MTSSDAFSTVANAFSVVGLADIVFKYGREVCETLVRIHNAPKEIQELLGEVKDVEDHVVRTRIFLVDFERSTLSKSNKQTIPAIRKLLARCQIEFDFILKSVKETTVTATDGWFGRFSKSTRWVWNEQDIALSRRRLGRLREELDSTLTLAGRESDIAIHTEMTNVHADVAQMSADSNAAFADLSTATATIDNKVDSVSTDIRTLHGENASQLSGITTTLTRVRDENKAGSAEIGRQLNTAADNSETQFCTLRKEINGGSRSVRQDLKAMSKNIKTSTRQHTRQQNSANARLMARFDQIESALTENLATINLTQTAEAFTFEGSNLESATLPLSLLHSELIKALPALKSEGKIKISQDEASWIQPLDVSRPL
ncbi:hypothetical protein SLS56_000576 [Neofusicoccum ribis]|uniref:Fungal N-terminal domain-containing protein n=1 Tax=Neofusicoccum ribis TaxID=45134 RepID=A0ABR3TCZ5_9PEZI